MPRLDPLATFFLLLTTLIIPFLAVRSHQHLSRGKPMPPTRALHLNTLVVLLVLTALALWVARRVGLTLFPPPRPDPALAAITTGVIVATLLVGLLRWRYRSDLSRARLVALLPRAGADWLIWLVLCAAAGIGEEIVYRGVLFSTLNHLTGRADVSLLIGALAFGLAHAVQGWLAVAITTAIGAALQGLVLRADDLYLAMAAHFTYDVLAGVLFAALARRDALAAPGASPPDPPARDP